MNIAELLAEADAIIERIHQLGDLGREGNAERLPLYVCMHKIGKVLEVEKEATKVAALDDARKQKGTVVAGALIGYTEGARKWDYSRVPAVASIEAMLKDAQDKAKALITVVGSGGKAINEETGEELVAAIEMRGAESISITYKP